MALSFQPAACSLAIFSFAGFEKLHSSMAQVATVSLQPHWQPICAPTRRTSTLGFSAAVSANTRPAERTSRPDRKPALFRDFGIFSRNPDYFRAGVLHFHFAGDQAHQCAADQDQATDPDPGDQREDISLNDRALAVIGHAAEIEIKVLVEPGTHTHFRRALTAGFVEALLGFQRAEQISAAVDQHAGAVPLVVVVLAFLQVRDFQLIVAQ